MFLTHERPRNKIIAIQCCGLKSVPNKEEEEEDGEEGLDVPPEKKFLRKNKSITQFGWGLTLQVLGQCLCRSIH